MIKDFWKIQEKIQVAIESENDVLLDELGEKQDNIVIKMSDSEFKDLMSNNLPIDYKIYANKIRKQDKLFKRFNEIRYDRTLLAKDERESILNQLSNEQIDKIIDTSNNTQAKIYYSKFKKNKEVK